MSMLYPKSREEWLTLRAEHVSSTESSALFGMNPYTTAFELAVLKKSKSTEEYESNERMEWGLRLQRTIAEGVAETYGVKIRAVSGYASRLPENRIGASFDFEIVGATTDPVEDSLLRDMYKQHGPGVLEIKNVDSWIFKQQWAEIGDSKQIEAPAHIELQVQHQLECIEREWAAIGVLVGGNRQVLIVRMRDRDVGQAIRAKVGGFYRKLANGEMPPVTLPQDADAIKSLYRYAEPGKVIDLQGETVDPKFADIDRLVREHAAATSAKSAAEKVHKGTGAALLMAIGDAEKVLLKGATVSASMIGPTRVEAYDRAGYRNLRVYEKKVKEQK